MNKLVYLAGPITGLSYEGATDWREATTLLLAEAGLVGLSPLRAKDYLKNVRQIADSYADFGLSTPKAVTARDRFDCQRAGLVIFNFLGAEKASIGSCIELGWADAARVPAILVIEPEGNIHDHGMVRECCGWRVASVTEAVHICKAVLA